VEQTKRKTKTSTEVKSRYNQKAYDVISIRVPKETAEAFKSKCADEGVAQAQVIKNAIELYHDKEKWDALVANVMAVDFSWNVSAQKYIAIYKELM